MSGIAVLLSRDGRPIHGRYLRAMIAAVPYRGPDGMRVCVWPEVGLGHAKLTVTAEEEGERQPLVSAQTGCVVVADVRLDNRDELLRRLPGGPRDLSDAALILRAYETWGLEAPTYLLGDFAFVIWDPRAARLFCARDGAGQRPLFYRQDHRVFAVASEVHQLLQDPAVPIVPDDERVRDALVPINLHRNEKDSPSTFYAGIRAVRAGGAMVIDAQSQRSWTYWQLQLPPELHYRQSSEYADQFRELLLDAVRARLRTSRPLGVLLSGGLDSTAITCAAQELYRDGRATDTGFVSLSAVYEGLECDERAFIEPTQQQYGFPAQYVAPDASADPLTGGLAGFRERPNLPTDGYDTLLREGSRLGLRALLTGEISDAYVRGTPLVLDSLLRQGQFGAFWRYLQAYRAQTRDPWLKIASLYVVAPFLPLPVHRTLAMRYVRRAHQRLGHHLLPAWMPEALSRDLANRHLELSLAEERTRRTSSEAKHWDLLGLNPPEAMASPAGWPVQFWRPFADRRLQEFLLAVPPQEKYEPHPATPDSYAGSKQLLRRGFAGVMPEGVRTRTHQTHFASAAADRVKRQWAVLEGWFGPAAQPRLAERGYIVPDRFWSRLQQIRDGRLGLDFLHLDYCIGLEFWLRSLEQPHQQAVTVQTSWSAPDIDIQMDTFHPGSQLGRGASLVAQPLVARGGVS